MEDQVRVPCAQNALGGRSTTNSQIWSRSVLIIICIGILSCLSVWVLSWCFPAANAELGISEAKLVESMELKMITVWPFTEICHPLLLLIFTFGASPICVVRGLMQLGGSEAQRESDPSRITELVLP